MTASSTKAPNRGRRQSLTTSVLNTLEEEALQQRRRDEINAWRAWLILPNSRFLKLWLAIIGPLIVYNAIWVPLEVSQMAVANKLHGQVDFVLDLFFYVDLVINMRTAYISKENELVLDGRLIARRYLSGSFTVDLIATVQWEIFTGRTAFSQGKGSQFTAAFSVLRLPRLLRLLRLFKKLDIFPHLKLAKLIFLFSLITHWVGCLWFLIGWMSISLNKADGVEAISPHGILRRSSSAQFANFPDSASTTFGDSWLLRHFGPKHLNGAWTSGADPLQSVAYTATNTTPGGPVSFVDNVDVGQIYFTSLYWSLTMLMKSPHIGPDTWIEKLFSCLMVLLGLFVTTQIVAVVTQMVLSFDKAGSTFRDRQQEYVRFASSRSLPPSLRRKLLKYSLQDWGCNQGFDPLEVIKQHRLPPALTNAILASIYDDVVQESPLLRVFEVPVLHELLRYVKTVVSLQKETLINQSDPCTRMYILRAGSLQASATERLMQQTQGDGGMTGGASEKRKSKAGGKGNWKQKMQVRMIERPGEVICCASPHDPPHPLPFQVTSLSKTTLLAIHMQDLITVLGLCSEPQKQLVCKQMAKEHQNILRSVMPKTKDPNMRDSRVSIGDADAMERSPDRHSATDMSARRSSTRMSVSDGAGAPDSDFGERRLAALEADIDRCIRSMAMLHKQARAIPRMVAVLSRMHNRPVQPMSGAAEAAVKSGKQLGGSPQSPAHDSELDELQREMADA